MKIQPIVNVYPSQCKYSVSKNLNFRGLEGLTEFYSEVVDMTQGVEIEGFSTQYYPFLGESKHKTEQFIKENSYSDNKYRQDKVDVKEVLPFTESEFKKYRNGELQHSFNPVMRNLANTIETSLRKLDLTKFIK